MENIDKEKIENENKIVNNPNDPINYIDKVFKFITKEKRELIGKLKAFNREGNFYLIDCVEVFNKKSDNFYMNDLFNNNEDHQFYYETDNYQYQYINNCVFPLEEIGDIYMLKDEIYQNYKILLDNYYNEINEKKKKEEERKRKEEYENIENKINVEEKKPNDNIEELLDSILKEEKKKKKKKKKKK